MSLIAIGLRLHVSSQCSP